MGGSRRNGNRRAGKDKPPGGEGVRPRKKRNGGNGPRRQPSGWRNGLYIGSIAFVIAMILAGPLGGFLQNVSLFTGALLLTVSIGVAIVADILAVAATAGDEGPFNAMASNKVPGAREALKIVRNAGRVNSFFSDVIGDICGTISGVVATPIILALHDAYPHIPLSVIGMLVIGLIAFFTVGGKAAEKSFAVDAATSVILWVGKAIYYVNRMRWVRRFKR